MHDSKTKKSEASNTGLEQACSARRFFNHSCHVQLPHEQTQYLIAQAEEAEGGATTYSETIPALASRRRQRAQLSP